MKAREPPLSTDRDRRLQRVDEPEAAAMAVDLVAGQPRRVLEP